MVPAGHCCEHPGAGPHSLGIHTRACWARCEHLGAGWPRNAIPPPATATLDSQRATPPELNAHAPLPLSFCSASARDRPSRQRNPRPLYAACAARGKVGGANKRLRPTALQRVQPSCSASRHGGAAGRSVTTRVIEWVITAYTLRGRACSTQEGHTSLLINLKVR